MLGRCSLSPASVLLDETQAWHIADMAALEVASTAVLPACELCQGSAGSAPLLRCEACGPLVLCLECAYVSIAFCPSGLIAADQGQCGLYLCRGKRHRVGGLRSHLFSLIPRHAAGTPAAPVDGLSSPSSAGLDGTARKLGTLTRLLL